MQHIALGLVPKQISTGDRTILGSISKRGNRYLRVLFVQAAWVVLTRVRPENWERYGLKSWIEAAQSTVLGLMSASPSCGHNAANAYAAWCRYCCKSRKLPGDDFPAKSRSD
jgi:hypothetical protein